MKRGLLLVLILGVVVFFMFAGFVSANCPGLSCYTGTCHTSGSEYCNNGDVWTTDVCCKTGGYEQGVGCDNGGQDLISVSYKLQDCANGCSGGACTAGCTDACSKGEKQCSGDNTQYRTCGDYNGDGCREWSSYSTCSAGQTCSNGNCVAPLAYQIISARFKNLNGGIITSADSGDTVLLEVNGVNLSQANSQINFSIKNKTNKWIFSTKEDIYSDILSSIFWQITSPATDRVNFTANLTKIQNYSGNLDISALNNALPVVAITSPANNSNFNYSSIVSFTQTSSDIDDLLELSWDFGDGSQNVVISNYTSVNSASGNVQHNYTNTGTFVVKLTAKEMSRGQNDSASLTINIKLNQTTSLFFCEDPKFNTSNACNNAGEAVATNSVGNGSKICGIINDVNWISGTVRCTNHTACACVWNNTLNKCTARATTGKTCNNGLNETAGYCSYVVSEPDIKCGNGQESITYTSRASWVTANNTTRDANCKDIVKTFQCPETAQLPFFGFFNLIFAVLGVVCVYLISLRKK